jgi:hypothetical protein
MPCIFCHCHGTQVLEINQAGAAKIKANLGDPDRWGHYYYYYETPKAKNFSKHRSRFREKIGFTIAAPDLKMPSRSNRIY